jgi:hypothetical protein
MNMAVFEQQDVYGSMATSMAIAPDCYAADTGSFLGPRVDRNLTATVVKCGNIPWHQETAVLRETRWFAGRYETG